MAEYQTEQKKLLLQFLREHKDRAFSMDELVRDMKCCGAHAPGKSTVYRLMLHLLEEKRVRRFVEEGGRGFVYQLVADDHCHEHLHLRCNRCGRLLHLDEGLSRELLELVHRTASFSVNNDDTVLFGVCADCGGAR